MAGPNPEMVGAVQQVLQPQGDIGSMVWAVKADEQLMAVKFI